MTEEALGKGGQEASVLEHAEVPPEESASETPARRRWPWLLVVMAAAVGLAAVFSAGFGRDPSVVPSVLIDEPAPALVGPILEGGHFDLADYDGQVVIVNVWASWCTVCRAEHPELEAAASRLAPSGVQFVGLNTQDNAADARAFLDEMGGSSYPSVIDEDGRKAVDWGIFGVPETFLVDPRGRVRAKIAGTVTEAWLLSGVEQVLAEEFDS